MLSSFAPRLRKARPYIGARSGAGAPIHTLYPRSRPATTGQLGISGNSATAQGTAILEHPPYTLIVSQRLFNY